MGEDNRADDQRITEIHADVKAMMTTINGISIDIAVVRTKAESTQIELSEHKTSHWQTAFLVIGGSGVFASLIGLVVSVFLKK